MVFSADGASLYVGTAGGKLLVQTLRSTEPPKVIAVGEQGCKVEGLAIVVRTSFLVVAQFLSPLLPHRERTNI
jgi:hypothetical protein